MPAEPTMPPLRAVLCAPRGFCVGVVRAIEVVERALEPYGPPVYVCHEIVHNRHVGDSLKAKGVIFNEALSEAPPGPHPVILSARDVEALRERYEVKLDTLTTATESMAFTLPRSLRRAAA